MALIRRDVCQINSLKPSGLGGCQQKDSSEIIEIPYTIPGDVVEFEEHSYRGKTSFVLTKIIENSKNRVKAPCKYFGICGGCFLQHLDENYYKQSKIENLHRIFNQYNIGCDISAMKSIGPLSRRRAIFEAIKKHEQIFFGFKKFHSNQIVNIDSCLLLIPELSELINKFKNMLGEFLNNKEKCKILVTKADNGIDLIIETNDKGIISQKQIEFLKNFAINNQITRLTIIDNNKWNIIYCAEKPYILFENVKVEINNHSFLQVSKNTDLILADLINASFNKLEKPLEIVDLFCGSGTLTVAASKFGSVDGFEIEKSSVKSLKEAARNFNLPINIFERDLFINPLKWDELNKYDIAMINPPRAGAQEQSEILAKSTLKSIIYLSCNLETFARDAKIITKNNKYYIEELIAIDQFHWNPNLELFATFKLVS